MKMKASTIALCAVLLLLGGLNMWRVNKVNYLSDRLGAATAKLEHVTKHWEHKSGGTTTWPGSNGEILNYKLRSFDGGRIWYAVEYDDEGRMTIKGPAEEVYPGLLEHLEKWAALKKHVQKNGPIDPTKAEGRKLLEGAGFTVTEKSEGKMAEANN